MNRDLALHESVLILTVLHMRNIWGFMGFCLLFCFCLCSARDETQGFVHAKQALYTEPPPPQPCGFVLTLFWSSLKELRILIYLGISFTIWSKLFNLCDLNLGHFLYCWHWIIRIYPFFSWLLDIALSMLNMHPTSKLHSQSCIIRIYTYTCGFLRQGHYTVQHGLELTM
jgi:hypothetical protein